MSQFRVWLFTSTIMVIMIMTNQTADGNMTGVGFLSMQTAQSGSLSQINTTAYSLELNNVSDSSILFSDRPGLVETVSTADFIDNWSAGQNSFSADAPNDALIVAHSVEFMKVKNLEVKSTNDTMWIESST